jgi:parallel beta-helix repeat protein
VDIITRLPITAFIAILKGILVEDSHRNKIASNRLNSNNGAGIFLTSSSDQNLITDNIIKNNSQGVLSIDAGFNKFDKNVILENKVQNVETYPKS